MKAALVQLSVREGETADNRFQRVQSLLSRFLESGKTCDLMVLPELWRVGFSHFEQYSKMGEPRKGGTVRTFSRWAQRLNCTMIPGSFVEKSKEGVLYNTMPLLAPDGALLAEYRKMHLFGYESRERELLTAGQQVVVEQTPLGRMGLATCYDLRFPEQFRAMVDRGAELFCVAAAWPRQRMSDWRSFCRVRAMENQCFLFACNHAGIHAEVAGAGH
ncbi:MAG: nitrilase-related carbon-nitrogen hydrolase, partial [Butyricicoccus sp.]